MYITTTVARCQMTGILYTLPAFWARIHNYRYHTGGSLLTTACFSPVVKFYRHVGSVVINYCISTHMPFVTGGRVTPCLALSQCELWDGMLGSRRWGGTTSLHTECLSIFYSCVQTGVFFIDGEIYCNLTWTFLFTLSTSSVKLSFVLFKLNTT